MRLDARFEVPMITPEACKHACKVEAAQCAGIGGGALCGLDRKRKRKKKRRRKKRKEKKKEGRKKNRKNELSIFLEIMICNLY
jgi:CRISPR/Cas system-associated protein Cas7 (RAMP superfamily)